MRVKVTITLDSGEEITEVYDINRLDWLLHTVAIETFILHYINIEREEGKKETQK